MNFSMLNFFKRSQKKLEIVRVNTTEVRLKQWRSDEAMLSASKTLQGNHTYILMTNVLRNELAAMAAGLPLAATVPEQVSLQRLVQGYQLCLDHMASMSKKPEKQKVVEETYSPENDLTPKQNNKRPVPQGMGW